MTTEVLPRVAVFDIDLPPGIAVVRSLGRRGVPIVAYAHATFAAGKFSRYIAERRTCPPVYGSDEFVQWLVEEMTCGHFDLIALTSDYVAFNVMEAFDILGADTGGHPQADAVRRCLFKDEFASAMECVGFPTPASGTPADLDQAIEIADRIGYPVVLKPRSHVGIGITRGAIVNDPDELRRRFHRYEVHGSERVLVRHDEDLGLPLIQEYIGGTDYAVLSVTGCLAPDSTVLAVSHSWKVGGWPDRLGVATRFDKADTPDFADAAVSAVQSVLGAGIFELEVLVHQPTGEHWAIDLNPRAFGQITFDMARGSDLPVLWYESMTGRRLPPLRHRTSPTVSSWHQGVLVLSGALSRIAHGPRRWQAATDLARRFRTPHVGSVADWRDPLPGLLFTWRFLRHPRSLFRTTRPAAEMA